MTFWILVGLSIVIAVIGTIVFEWFLFLFEVVSESFSREKIK